MPKYLFDPETAARGALASGVRSMSNLVALMVAMGAVGEMLLSDV